MRQLLDVVQGRLVAQSRSDSRFSNKCERLVVVLLRLLACQLRRLCSCRVDPLEVGVIVPGSDTTKPGLRLDVFHAELLEFMTSSHVPSPLQLEIAAVVDAGLDVFYPTSTSRTRLMSWLFSSQRSRRLDESSVEGSLLTTLLRRFSTLQGVVSLLPSEASVPAAAAAVAVTTTSGGGDGDVSGDTIDSRSLLNSLIAITVDHSRSAVLALVMGDADDGSGGDPRLQEAASTLLSRFQRHLVGVAAVARVPEDRAFTVLQQYVVMMLDAAQQVLAVCLDDGLAAIDAITDSDVRASRLYDLENILASSAFGSLLPVLLTALTAFPNSVWMAEAVLPVLLPVLRQLDAVVRRLPSAAAACAAVDEQRLSAQNRFRGPGRAMPSVHTGYGVQRRSEDASGRHVYYGPFYNGQQHGRGVKLMLSAPQLTQQDYIDGHEVGLTVQVPLSRTPAGEFVIGAVQYSSAGSSLPRSSDPLKVLLRGRSLLNAMWAGVIELPESRQRQHFVVHLNASPAPHQRTGVGMYVAAASSYVATGRGRVVTDDVAHFRVSVWSRNSGRVCVILTPLEAHRGPVADGVDRRLPNGTSGRAVVMDADMRTVYGSAFSGVRGTAGLLVATEAAAISTLPKETATLVPADAAVDKVALHLWQVPASGHYRHWLLDLHLVMTSVSTHLAVGMVKGVAPDAAETEMEEVLTSTLMRGGLDVRDDASSASATAAACALSALMPPSVAAVAPPTLPPLLRAQRLFLRDLVVPGGGTWTAVAAALQALVPEKGLRARRKLAGQAAVTFADVESCYLSAMLHHMPPHVWQHVAALGGWTPPADAGADASAVRPPARGKDTDALLVAVWRYVLRMRSWLLQRRAEFGETGDIPSTASSLVADESKTSEGVERESKSSDDAGGDGVDASHRARGLLTASGHLSWSTVQRFLPAMVPAPSSMAALLSALRAQCCLLFTDVTPSFDNFARAAAGDTPASSWSEVLSADEIVALVACERDASGQQLGVSSGAAASLMSPAGVEAAATPSPGAGTAAVVTPTEPRAAGAVASPRTSDASVELSVVLKRQRSLLRQVSLDNLQSDDEDAGEGEEEDGEGGGGDGDDGGDGDSSLPAAVSASLKAVLAFVMHAGRGTAPAASVRAGLLRRAHRATSRAIGLAAMARLADVVTPTECKQLVLLRVRPSLHVATTTSEDPAEASSALVRNVQGEWHPAALLGGCPRHVSLDVQRAFVLLASVVSGTLSTALSRGDVVLGQSAMAALALSWRPDDHMCLLHLDVIPSLMVSRCMVAGCSPCIAS